MEDRRPVVEHMMSGRAEIVQGLAEKYYERVLGFARQLTEESTAEDVAQEVFARLMRLDDLEDRALSVSYLLKAAHNLVKTAHRTKMRRQHHLDLFARAERSRRAEQQHAVGCDGAASLPIERVPAHQFEAVRLTVAHDLSLREAANALDVPVTTVTNWKYRGLRALDPSPAA